MLRSLPRVADLRPCPAALCALGLLGCAVQIVADDAAASEVLEADEFDAATQDRCGCSWKTRPTPRQAAGSACTALLNGSAVLPVCARAVQGPFIQCLLHRCSHPPAGPSKPCSSKPHRTSLSLIAVWCLPLLQHPLRSGNCEAGCGRCSHAGAHGAPVCCSWASFVVWSGQAAGSGRHLLLARAWRAVALPCRSSSCRPMLRCRRRCSRPAFCNTGPAAMRCAGRPHQNLLQGAGARGWRIRWAAGLQGAQAHRSLTQMLPLAKENCAFGKKDMLATDLPQMWASQWCTCYAMHVLGFTTPMHLLPGSVLQMWASRWCTTPRRMEWTWWCWARVAWAAGSGEAGQPWNQGLQHGSEGDMGVGWAAGTVRPGLLLLMGVTPVGPRRITAASHPLAALSRPRPLVACVPGQLWSCPRCTSSRAVSSHPRLLCPTPLCSAIMSFVGLGSVSDYVVSHVEAPVVIVKQQ